MIYIPNSETRQILDLTCSASSGEKSFYIEVFTRSALEKSGHYFLHELVQTPSLRPIWLSYNFPLKRAADLGMTILRSENT